MTGYVTIGLILSAICIGMCYLIEKELRENDKKMTNGFSSGDVSEITMSEDAYEDFLESLEAPLTEEEKQGRERLFQTPYPWNESKTVLSSFIKS